MRDSGAVMAGAEMAGTEMAGTEMAGTEMAEGACNNAEDLAQLSTLGDVGIDIAIQNCNVNCLILKP